MHYKWQRWLKGLQSYGRVIITVASDQNAIHPLVTRPILENTHFSASTPADAGTVLEHRKMLVAAIYNSAGANRDFVHGAAESTGNGVRVLCVLDFTFKGEMTSVKSNEIFKQAVDLWTKQRA